ncbi:DUF3320 domain-containing protein [Pseudovibrio sp. Alg231-02]|uniref:DUF3320 domain-containing protein n=1 Tax=Pseudovibrio sp. Alg231-02 TaxID=1922223 RepID=UPI000D550272|nr:DUF3320 domain-containing protein [Pseudovibrio sp. Alg231-02]
MLEITQEARAEETDCGVSFQVTISSVVNYASWQNSVPLLSMVELHNSAEHAQNNLTLELSFTPSFAKAKSWKIDRLPADETLSLSNLEVTLDPDYLQGLDEAEKGVAVFHLRNAEGELVAEHRKELRLLARDEWGGFAGMASIAAAFVMPNDPAIAQVQRDAGEVLVKYGYSPALDGYQSKDPKRVYMLGAALWSAVAGMGLMYAEPPKSFEVHGQKVRRPSTIREQGLATCFDSTLFFASALEAIGLNPVVLIIEGHSYCGFWLRETTLPSLIEQDPTEIRKALAARELIVFETTGITRRPADQFDKAIAIAKSYTNEENEAGFIGAIDIARARASQIRPMASHQAASSENHAEAPEFEATTLPLPKAPSFDALPTDEAEESPRTPKDRIARWQNKLLDLSLRNRLLNFKSTKQTVPFLCTDVPLLEDRLAERKKIRVISLPEENPHGERDEDLHLKKTGQDLDEEFAAQAIARNELPSTLEKRELDKRLTELFRRAKNDLNEGGSNTLFLAVGFLRWKKSADDEKAYKAPLLLIPVKLTRKSAASRFNLEHHEDEVRFNATLMEFLKKDYNLSLPPFDAKLPTDESGIDVPYVFEMVRKAVRDVPGFEVVDETALSTFSFAKFLMWKDLVERTDDLRKNRVVRHLIDNPDKAFEPGVSTAFPSERDIDVKYDPKDIITPLPADSSQLSAVMAAVEGQDFILVGPPGTGKSQTITNMIAQCLANNKSVLFVAEKTAALDVVYRRLREHGLGEFCLELHSNKAERKQFLEQLKTSWEQGSKPDTGEWVRINEQLKVRRDHLNDYITALHTPSACGLTVFDALGLAVKHANEYVPKLNWDNNRTIGKETLAQLQDTVSEIASVHREVQPIPALNLIKHQDWSVRWQNDLLDVISETSNVTSKFLEQLDAFNQLVDFKTTAQLSLQDIEDICSFSELVLSTQDTQLRVVFEEHFDEIKTSASKFVHQLDTFNQLVDFKASDTLILQKIEEICSLAELIQSTQSMKLDRVSEERFDELKTSVSSFLHQLIAFNRLANFKANGTHSLQDIEEICSLAELIQSTQKTQLGVVFEERFDEIKASVSNFLHQLDYFNQLTDFKASDTLGLQDIEEICSLAELIQSTQETQLGVVFEERFDDIKSSAQKLEKDIIQFKKAETQLNASYDEATILRLPMDSLDHNWREACSKMWPFSAFAKGKIRKLLQTYTQSGTASPETEISQLREMQDALNSIQEQTDQRFYPKWDGTQTETEKLRSYFDLAEKVKAVLAHINHHSNATIFKNEQFRSCLENGEVGHPLRLQSQKLLEAKDHFHVKFAQLCEFTNSLRNQGDRRSLPKWEAAQADIDQLRSYLGLAYESTKAIRHINHLSNATVFKNEELRSSLSEGRADDPLRLQAAKLIGAAKLFRDGLGRFCRAAGSSKDHFEGTAILHRLQDDLQVLTDNSKQLQVWTEWQKVKTTAENQNLTPFIEAAENQLIPHEDLEKRFTVAFANWWLPEAIDNTPVLRSFKRFKHEEMLQQFRKLDDQVRATAAYKVQSALNHKLPSQHAVPKSSELGTLRHQMNLKRPSKSIRDVISAMPGTFSKLAPCLLMSPLSISQYLPAGQSQFDVVIFDEASQITTWDAVGAIARGTQTIIVGDPKQLPPTNFFGRSEQDDDEELEAYEKDLESILEEAKASGLPNLQLNWHYRSRHESLIAFSNWHYYDNRLITFPSPVVADRAVKLVHTPDAIYDRGKSRTNKLEAQNIVKEAVKRLRKWIDLPEEDRPTLGVITFNQQQQSLIQDLFDAELRNHPDLEWFFADERIEPVIVRNLENVQGDERDVMMFSITFAPDIAGKMSMSFGAINKDGGERRLNVAVTRAREELLIFSTVTADAIDTSRTKALGVKHLKEFLSFAEKGTIALAASDDGSVGGYDSPFEEAVSEALQMRGWTIVPQVGVSGFRVDLGIVHPDKPGAFIAGVECDGATYHSSATARDRDKVREQVLRNLGWEILRIWSPDWWYDSQHVADEIHHKLRDLLVDSRAADKLKAEQAAEAEKLEEERLAFEAQLDESIPDTSLEEVKETTQVDRIEPLQSTPLHGNHSVTSASNAPSPTSKPYEWTDLSGLAPDPDKFHDADYAPTLLEMIRKIVSDEGPIKDTALAQRITKAHGWSRTGAVLRREIEKHFANFDLHEETSGTFVWEKDSKTQLIGFRPAVNKDYRRSVTDIPIAEIAGLIDEQPHLLSEEDPVNAIARTMGYDRVAAAIRARVAEAIEYFRAHSG